MSKISKYQDRLLICGFTMSELEDVLTNRSEEYISMAKNGTIFVKPKDKESGKDNKIVKCVKEYYNIPGKKALKVSSTNPYLRCQKIQEALHIPPNISRLECKLCHCTCMSMARNGGGLHRCFK